MKRTAIKTVIILCLFLIGLVFYGCDSTTKDTNKNQVSEDDNEKVILKPEPIPGSNQPDPKLDNTEAKSDLQELFSKKSSIEYSVNYDVKSKYGESIQDGELSFYYKGTKVRNDYSYTQDGEKIESRYYVPKENQVISCMNVEGGWNCFEFTDEDYNDQNNAKTPDIRANMEDIENDMNTYTVQKSADRTIAQTKAICYKFSHSDLSYEMCYSKDGVPLLMDIKGTDYQSTYTAKSYKTSVPDSDFEPPAEPMDMQSYIGSMMNK